MLGQARVMRLAISKKAFANFVGVPVEELIATTSCTEGLFQSFEALGLGADDEVLFPSVSYIGAAHAAHHSGAKVALADVDPATMNTTTEILDRAVTKNTRALVVLHYGGRAGDIAEIAQFAKTRGLVARRRCRVRLGATSAGRACGTFGDVGVWSFDAMKIISAGDGGMIWGSRSILA